MEDYENCTRCSIGIKTKEECYWNDGEPFCSDSCVEEYEEEMKED